MVDVTVIETIRAYIRRLKREGLDVRFAVLFGSYAGGCADEWSDIDLVVVSPVFDGQKRRDDVDRLWVAALDVDARIEPVPCGLKEWADGDERAVIESARRQGYAIELAA